MLELTVCVTLLKGLIMPQSMLLADNDTRRLANGISQHKIVISEELKEQYLNYCQENEIPVEHMKLFLAKYMNIESKCCIVDVGECTKFKNETNPYLKALKNTCYKSQDKIILSDHSKLNKTDLASQGIELIRKNETNIDVSFNSYTKYTFPIVTWRISKDEDSKELGAWLGRIIKEEDSFVIYDNYFGDPNNIKNFKKYVLKYIPKNKDITIVTIETNDIKKQDITEELKKELYKDWNIEVYLAKNKIENHPRVISMPHCTIELDRGLSTFGKEGKTFSSSVTIRRNEIYNAYRNDVGTKIFP